MTLRFARTIVFALGFAIAALGCSGTDPTAADETANSQSSAVTPAPWSASYVSQSFPLATTALKMKAGEVIPSYIELKNSGTETWDTNTRIGTTEPRDRASVFADSTWVNASRPSQVTGTVAPGGTFKFTFDLKAPATPGTYKEYFGVLEEGVVWFGDSGQGGPVDSDLEVLVEVSAADPVSDAGATDDDGGVSESDSGAISVSEIPEGADAGAVTRDPSADPEDESSGGGKSGGCSISSRNGHFYGSNAIAFFAVLGVVWFARRRRAISPE